MKRKNRKNLFTSVALFVSFILWTTAVLFIDVKPIGPKGTRVGFSCVNALFHKLTGVHMTIYHITDWLSIVPVFVVLGFALVGVVQWIKRKKLNKVDYSILVLGGFYIAVMTVYLLFEIVCINYRPILINGALETSYPSSTTLLVMCVMPTAIMQFNSRIKNKTLNKCLYVLIVVFIVFMVIGRLISGVHWLTDIVGGALLSSALTMTYSCFIKFKK